MKFVGTALIRVEMDVPNVRVAQLKFEQEMKGNYYGVNKQVIVPPDFSDGIREAGSEIA